MLHLTRRGAGLLVAALATMLLTPSGHAASTDVPAPGQSPKIDAIKERGSLRVAAIGEFPWLPENTTGSGPQFSGPAWVLAEEYAEAPGRAARGRAGQPRDQGADPRDRRRRHLDRAARGHAEAPGGGRFRGLLALLACASSAWRAIPSCRTSRASTISTATTSPWPTSPARRPRPGRRRASRRSVPRRSPARAPTRRSRRSCAKRADFASIDNVAWPQLAKQVPGLVVFPAGDDCLQSNEMATGVGLAVDKKDTVFRDWLQAVYDEVKDKVTAAELELLKGT